MTEWFRAHPYIAYLIIFVLITYVYNKVFKMRKLPILKEAVVYLLLGVGAFMLLLFQLGALPIIPSLAVAVALMLMVRIRYFFQERTNRK
ncbi:MULTISPECIES: YlaH-like family protein [Paenibacillus]|uniref:YlaH-like family protein n=1 Tax=Paenibacillus radicis (ex Xue et al. 2023) TaxID=2972489 RepID=A0ABT1YP95_9BACL|nr:YlaH-like family protein [Paenibacillus radicis (ex Xue et al. 2023)]MCR8634996.1 YlaH-like family protein [Paenibacillus radicis (ex Xue et al. 2023)]